MAQYDELKIVPINYPHYLRISTVGTTSTGAALLSAMFPAFLCPSSSGNIKQDGWMARTNYRFCLGDNAQHLRLSTANTDKNLRGSFGFRSWYNFSAITDGTSNTLFFSERELPDTPANTSNNEAQLPTGQVKTDSLFFSVGSAEATAIFGGGNTTADPSYLLSRQACMSYATANGEYIPAVGAAVRARHGCLWTGYEYFQAFHTITPPNGASCEKGGPVGVIHAPTSRHPGGVIAALGDGAVRFISDSIDIGNGNSFGGLLAEGLSPFGVWGALGSRDGGETVPPF